MTKINKLLEGYIFIINIYVNKDNRNSREAFTLKSIGHNFQKISLIFYQQFNGRERKRKFSINNRIERQPCIIFLVGFIYLRLCM